MDASEEKHSKRKQLEIPLHLKLLGTASTWDQKTALFMKGAGCALSGVGIYTTKEFGMNDQEKRLTNINEEEPTEASTPSYSLHRFH